MRIGAVYPQIELDGDPGAVRAIATAVEEQGYDHLLVYDHVAGAEHADREPPLWGPYTERDPFHDPFVMLSHIAALTERIGLTTGVIILPQRQTALVARQAADLDLLSGERLRLGIGTGWNHVEYTALGQDFTTRGTRMSEQIELLRRCWGDELVSFDGRFDTVERAAFLPRPKRQIPIWVGGFSEPAFRRGAKLADGFIFAGKLDAVLTGWDRVRELLGDAGRSGDDFGADWTINRHSGIDQVVTEAERWREAGGTHLSVASMGLGMTNPDAHIEFFAEVRQALG
ncbi:MAG: LLM class F420-dependent oxidoreductase [Actinomycetota bacterium]